MTFMNDMVGFCILVHGFALLGKRIFFTQAFVLAKDWIDHVSALKPTHEAGWRGGDSIARRHVFNYQN